jgi:cytochrome c oxidase subunit IV
MAYDPKHDPHAPIADAHHAEAVAAGEVHVHPTWKEYKWVALILTLITVVEVWVYYIPAFVASRLFVPALLIMSAVKFAIVVMFYMHLKYDHKLFRALFTGPLIVAVMTILALLFLFSKLVVRAGG